MELKKNKKVIENLFLKLKCEAVAGIYKGGCTVRIMGCKHIPTLVYMQASLGRLPGTVHVSNTETDLTKSAPKPRAPAHTGLWRISGIINKKNMLTAVRWRSFITHVQAHTDPHRSTHRYMYAFSIFSAARGECDVPVSPCSLVLHALCTHMCIYKCTNTRVK